MAFLHVVKTVLPAGKIKHTRSSDLDAVYDELGAGGKIVGLLNHGFNQTGDLSEFNTPDSEERTFYSGTIFRSETIYNNLCQHPAYIANMQTLTAYNQTHGITRTEYTLAV